MSRLHCVLMLLPLLAVSACQRQAPETVKNARPVMGTLAELTAWAPDRATAQRAVDAGYGRLEDVNRLMSDYVADSEIGRLNALEPGASLAVSEETFACLQRALDVAQHSAGAFDVTCRPLVQLWKQAGKMNRLPSDEDLAATLERVGWQKLRLDPESRRVAPTVAGLQVDLGGIAKGYALDLAAQAMVAAGARGALIDVGGDIRAVGTRSDGVPWHIGVRHPFRGGRDVLCRLALTDCAVATSGVQERFIEIEGRRYSHIVDPRTGWPAEHAPSVTVIAPDGTTADAWATVFSVLSVEEGGALLARELLPRMEVMWIARDGSSVEVRKTPGFDQYVLD